MSETRERSFWGWGWADRFPDAETRRGIAEHAAGLLGLTGLEPREPPTLASLRMPEPRLAPPAELAAFASQGRLERALHTYGRSYLDVVRGFAGDFAPAPDLVLTPRTEAEVQAALAWCARERVAAIPFGGGTSVVRGVEAQVGPGFRGAASIDLGRLDRVLEVDATSRAARAQAGVKGPALEQQLGEHGLSLRHYPQSFEFSTLGGWIATRAGGHYASLYTHIDDLVEAVRMVTPAGVWEGRRLPASGAGPSPERLVLGSEGALGVITEAWVRVVPRPRWRSSATVRFDAFLGACEAARAVAQAGLFPANCRVLDPEEALLNGVPADGGAVLLLGFESADHPVNAWLERALALALEKGGACPRGPVHKESAARGGDAAAESWRQAFIDAPYLQTALVSVGVLADTFETACTWDKLPALFRGVGAAVEAALRKETGAARVTCRLTHVYPDGCAPYFTFVGRAPEGREQQAWWAVKRAASEAVLAHGGTITHHHAVGRLHRPWYDHERPDLFAAALEGAKRAVDPAGVMNPGVLVGG